MARCEVATEIARPAHEVFAALARIESLPEVVSSIVSVDMLTEGPVGVGTRFRETRVLFGKEASEVMEFSRFEPPREFEFVAESHGARYVTTTRVVDVSGGSRVEMSFEATPISAVAKLMRPLAGLMLGACRKAMRGDIEDIKAALESGVDSSPHSDRREP